MKSMRKLTMGVMAVAILLSCGTVEARRWHSRPSSVVTVVVRPTATAPVVHGCSQHERFKMAVGYLKKHEYLTVKKYAKMTELSLPAAKAELDAFAADRHRPIKAVMRGGKKIYTL